jgi:hypothetical protein
VSVILQLKTSKSVEEIRGHSNLKAVEFGAQFPDRVIAASTCGPTTHRIEIRVGMPSSLVHGARLPRQDETNLDRPISTQV